MIAKKLQGDGAEIRITFSLPSAEPEEPVWVVGDFNRWQEGATPLRKRSNGRRSAAIVVPTGSRLAFRYVTASGHWFDDDCSDGFEPNEHGGSNCLVLT